MTRHGDAPGSGLDAPVPAFTLAPESVLHVETSARPALCVDRAGLARMLDVSSRQISRLSDAGRIPAPIALGTCKRWRVEEIEEWLRAGGPPRREWQNLRSAVAAPRQHEA